MNVRFSARCSFTRWCLGLAAVAVCGLGISGCGTDYSPTGEQAAVYTQASPPPFVRSDPAPQSDFLGSDEWESVASGSVEKGKSKVTSGGRYSLSFASGSLTVSKLTATIEERDEDVIDIQLGPHGSQFSTPVTLTISYAGTNADPNSKNFQPGSLAFYYFNPVANIWEQAPGTDNVALRQYTVKLTHFSQYALAKVPTPGTGDW